MTAYEPGRIYSGGPIKGPQSSERVFLIWSSLGFFAGDHQTYKPGEVADIRGPLVVLDVPQMYATSWKIVADKIREGADTKSRSVIIADQIEEQTRPPLQVGWHEVVNPHNGSRDVMRWDGSALYWPAGHAVTDTWTPVHYIGPASEDQS